MTAEASENVVHKCISSAYSNSTCINVQWCYLWGIIPYDLLSSGTTENNNIRIQCLYSITMNISKWIYEISKRCSMCTKKNREIERSSKNGIQSSQNEKRFMAISQTLERLNWRSLNIENSNLMFSTVRFFSTVLFVISFTPLFFEDFTLPREYSSTHTHTHIYSL